MSSADEFLDRIEKYNQIWDSIEISVVFFYKDSYWNLLALEVFLT